MPSSDRTLLWCLLLWCAATCVPASAWPQASATSTAMQALIDGWSFGEELGPTHREVGRLELQPGDQELVIFFQAASAADAPLLFRYRMLGLSDDWTETHANLAHFWRLAPGDYVFEVEAATAAGEWPVRGAMLAVHQKPFFYQTWYAGVMVLAVVMLVGVQLLWQRDQLLKGQMGMVLEERNRIASECHDTLMAGFAAVSWQLEATAGTLHADAAEDQGTAASLDLARSMVSHCQAEARRIIWDLRNNDRITNKLSQALADAIDAFRLRGDVETTLAVQGDEVALSPTAVHHLTCIGQEAISNAIRHAKPSQILVQLRFESDRLCLLVRDDGSGFAAAEGREKEGHFGIPVMEERARKLGGHLQLSSSANRGTEVVVTVNFNGIHQPIVQQGTVVPWIGL